MTSPSPSVPLAGAPPAQASALRPPLAGAATGATAAPGAHTPTRRTTDAPTRTLHALIALSFAVAYVTGDSEHWRAVHLSAGFALIGALAVRLGYGLLGPRRAALSPWLRRALGVRMWWTALRSAGARPSEAAGRATAWRALLTGPQTQNLLVSASVVALLGLAPLLLASGLGAEFLSPPEPIDEWLEEGHEWLGQAMLLAVGVHVGTLALFSLLRRRNLARPMLDGRSAGRGPDLAPHDRRGLATLLLALALSGVAWQWSDLPGLPALRRSEGPQSGLVAGRTAHTDHDARRATYAGPVGTASSDATPTRRYHDDD